MKCQIEHVFRYDVKFKAPWKRPIGKRDKPLLFRVVEAMKKQHAGTEFPPNPGCVVFDGFAMMLSAVQLKKSKFETSVTVSEDPEDPSKKVDIKVMIEFISPPISIRSAIEAYEQGKTGNEAQPLEAVQALNVILTYSVSLDPQRFEVIGRKCFEPSKGENVVEIDAGKYLWLGSFQSVRVGWKIRLNIDMANKPSYMKSKYLGNRRTKRANRH